VSLPKPLVGRSNRLGGTNDSNEFHDDGREAVDQSWTKTERLAELFLKACAAGAPCHDLATALAESVLESVAVRLALDVLDGGDHRYARATELASAVLNASAWHAPRKAKGGGDG
jgi:hypothetical protein